MNWNKSPRMVKTGSEIAVFGDFCADCTPDEISLKKLCTVHNQNENDYSLYAFGIQPEKTALFGDLCRNRSAD